MIDLDFRQIDKEFKVNNFKFDSGSEELNDFFYNLSKNFVKQNYSQMYILVERRSAQIIGFFALSCCNIQYPQSKLSIEKIARYIPGALIGMLAIDKNFQRKGFGSDLIRKIIEICLEISIKIGCRCLIVDALTNLRAINFYLKFGFEFIVERLGKNIVNDLKRDVKSNNRSIKMYFDLFKIQR